VLTSIRNVATWRYFFGGIVMNGDKFFGFLATAALLTALTTQASATALNIGVGGNTLGPEFLITYGANGTFSTAVNSAYGADPGAYDGADDTYFGVVNNNSKVLSSIFLSSTLDIFGFDGDGIVGYNGSVGLGGTAIAGNANDTSCTPAGSTGCYGGPVSYFTGINSAQTSGNVVFGPNGIASGGTEIFSLEEPVALNTLTVSSSVPEPSTWVMMILGFVGLGFMVGRRKPQLVFSAA
jgi:hypothetical protein